MLGIITGVGSGICVIAVGGVAQATVELAINILAPTCSGSRR
jgi:hypothetical protein